jgi:hypothetical protein
MDNVQYCDSYMKSSVYLPSIELRMGLEAIEKKGTKWNRAKIQA